MRQTCEFNPQVDLAEVDQFGFVNITKSIQNGYVPGSGSSTILDYDGCDDPSAIMGKPHDIFEAYRLQDSLMDSIKYGVEGSSSKEDKN